MSRLPADDVGGWALRRRTAVMDFEDGRLAEAESLLNAVVAELRGLHEPHAREELAVTLADRATVRRYGNRWQEALDDLAMVNSMAAECAAHVCEKLQFSAQLARAELLCVEGTPVHDLTTAERLLGELERSASDASTLQELTCEIARQRADWAAVACLSRSIGARHEAHGETVPAVFSAVRTAQALIELGELDAAECLLFPALRFLELHGPPEQHARARLAYARIASARAQHDLAWDAALAGLALVDSLVRYIRSQDDGLRFVAAQLKHYETAFDVALATGGELGCARAWTIAERSKSFYVCQLIANGDLALIDGVDAAQVLRLREFEDAIDARERVAAALSGDAFARAMQIVRALHMERDDLLAMLMRASPQWAALRAPPPFAIENLLERLRGRYDVLSLFPRPRGLAGKSELHIFWADAAGIPKHCVECLSREEHNALEAHCGPSEADGARDVCAAALAPALAARMWPAGLSGDLSRQRPLLLSAHGVFAALALHAARLEGARPPVELCPVVTVPTLASHEVLRAHWELAGVPQVG